MRMQSHKELKDFVWNPVMVAKSGILVKDNMTAWWWTKTKATGERFRSFEADHKKAYQELMEKKLLEQF